MEITETEAHRPPPPFDLAAHDAERARRDRPALVELLGALIQLELVGSKIRAAEEDVLVAEAYVEGMHGLRRLWHGLRGQAKGTPDPAYWRRLLQDFHASSCFICRSKLVAHAHAYLVSALRIPAAAVSARPFVQPWCDVARIVCSSCWEPERAS